ncbi:nuclear transport factor 2 family protein [Streptomyces sp. NPDC052052]|uniref:nuclear transport factor 2 family protein n=1 Tax=Streptomyces sp. NPDC052052 TaxID=3154756 RepID=UPI0034333CB5
MREPSAGVVEAMEGELRLLDPLVRARADLLAQLLHPDYREIDSTGRVWDRDAMIALLTADNAPRPGPITVSGMRGAQLGDEVVHLTYDTERKGRFTHRSSLWRLTDGGWVLYFHQATPFDHADHSGPDAAG